MASFIGVKSLFYPVGLDCQTHPWWIAAAGVSPSVGLRPTYGETPAAILILIDAHSGPDRRAAVFVRPKKMHPDQQQLARELVRDGKSISAVARTFDVHPAMIYRVIER